MCKTAVPSLSLVSSSIQIESKLDGNFNHKHNCPSPKKLIVSHENRTNFLNTFLNVEKSKILKDLS